MFDSSFRHGVSSFRHVVSAYKYSLSIRCFLTSTRRIASSIRRLVLFVVSSCRFDSSTQRGYNSSYITWIVYLILCIYTWRIYYGTGYLVTLHLRYLTFPLNWSVYCKELIKWLLLLVVITTRYKGGSTFTSKLVERWRSCGEFCKTP